MKIAIVSPRKTGLSETFIQAQVERLSGEILHYHGGDYPTHLGDNPIAESVSTTKKIADKLKRQLSKSGLNHYEFLFRESLKKEKPDLVLVQYGVLGAKNLRAIASLRIPLVVHFHGYDASVHGILESLKTEYQAMFKYAKAIIGVSQKMISMLMEMGAPAEKLHYVCYGPNPKFEAVVPDYNSQRLLALGRFVDKKAPHLTILAFHKIAHQFPNAQLRFIGNGPLFQFCNDLVVHLGLEKQVHFLGAQGIDVALEEMSKSCTFVQHSRRAENGDMEGTPVAILEAQLAGLPVLSTQHAGIPDIVIEGQTGFLVLENDVNGMAASMEKILQNPNLAQNLGSKGKTRISENYTMDKYIQQLQKIIEHSAL